jgi:hypothetical protein
MTVLINEFIGKIHKITINAYYWDFPYRGFINWRTIIHHNFTLEVRFYCTLTKGNKVTQVTLKLVLMLLGQLQQQLCAQSLTA